MAVGSSRVYQVRVTNNKGIPIKVAVASDNEWVEVLSKELDFVAGEQKTLGVRVISSVPTGPKKGTIRFTSGADIAAIPVTLESTPADLWSSLGLDLGGFDFGSIKAWLEQDFNGVPLVVLLCILLAIGAVVAYGEGAKYYNYAMASGITSITLAAIEFPVFAKLLGV